MIISFAIKFPGYGYFDQHVQLDLEAYGVWFSTPFPFPLGCCIDRLCYVCWTWSLPHFLLNGGKVILGVGEIHQMQFLITIPNVCRHVFWWLYIYSTLTLGEITGVYALFSGGISWLWVDFHGWKHNYEAPPLNHKS